MMKKLLFALSLIVMTLCGCSPKIVGGASADSIPASHPDYAVIYFYRPGNFAATPYDVHIGDDVVYRSKNKTKTFVKIDKPGTYEIWGKTESRESLTLKVEMGKDYYIKSFLHFGVALWRPSLEEVAPEVGKVEWNSIR